MRNVATLMLGAALALLIAGNAHADVKVSADARRHFRAGVQLMEDPEGPRWEEAYRAFRAAFRASPSPKILGNMGLCAMKLERDGEAIAAYQRYLSEAGAVDESERKQITRDLQVMTAGLVKLRIKTVPGWATIIDERRPVTRRPVFNRYSSEENGSVVIGVRAGVHRVNVRHEGYEAQTWEFEAQAGDIREKTFTLKSLDGEAPAGALPAEPAPSPEHPDRPDEPPPADAGDSMTPVWIGLGVTGALAIGGGVVGGLSLANKSDFDDALAAGDNAEAQELRDTGLVLNVATDALLGGAIVAAGVTTILWLTRSSGDDEEATAGVRWTPWIGPGWVGARGKF